MIQSSKTMLRVRDNEIVRLRQKLNQSEIRSPEQIERYSSDVQASSSPTSNLPYNPRAYNRSTDSRVTMNGSPQLLKQQQHNSYSLNEDEYQERSSYEEGSRDLTMDQRKPRILPSIEKTPVIKGESSFSNQRGGYDGYDSPILKSNYSHNGIKLAKSNTKSSQNIFDPSTDLEPKSRDTDIVILPLLLLPISNIF